jgi:thiamine kinase-like enzyme
MPRDLTDEEFDRIIAWESKLRAENARLRALLIETRKFLKNYQRSNATWHNDAPTYEFITRKLDPVLGEE